jgi:hypothetical protein
MYIRHSKWLLKHGQVAKPSFISNLSNFAVVENVNVWKVTFVIFVVEQFLDYETLHLNATMLGVTHTYGMMSLLPSYMNALSKVAIKIHCN